MGGFSISGSVAQNPFIVAVPGAAAASQNEAATGRRSGGALLSGTGDRSRRVCPPRLASRRAELAFLTLIAIGRRVQNRGAQ